MSSYSDLARGKKLVVFWLIALTTFCSMGDYVITPISFILYDVFSNESAVNFLLTGPYLVSAVLFLIVGSIADRSNKKLLLAIGVGVYAIGGIGGVLIENVYYMSFMHCLSAGVGYPFIQTAGLAIVAELFTDPAEHGKFCGFYNATLSIGGSILGLASGYVALTGWQNVWNIYWFTVPLLLLILFLIPNISASKIASSEGEARPFAARPKGWWRNLIPILAFASLGAACFMSIMYLGSVYVADAGLGDEAFAGTFASVGTLGSCIMSAAFGFFFAKIRDAVPVPAFILIGAGFLCMTLFPSKSIALIFSFLTGGGWGTFQSYFFARSSDFVPDGCQGAAIALVSFVYTIGCFFNTYLTTGIQDAMGSATILPAWTVLGVVCFVLAGFAVLFAVSCRRRDRTVA